MTSTMTHNTTARQQLHFTVENDELLPGRENELETLSCFLKSFIHTGTSGEIMYVSGVPGTGKTATVMRAIHNLKKGSYQLISVNGMEVVRPICIYQEIWKQMHESKHRIPSPQVCLTQLENIFKSKAKPHMRARRILVVDEIDFLITKDQKILYSIFEWPNRETAHVCLIAISNTMNLPELIMPRCSSRLGFRRLDFHAYSASQIEIILKQRLSINDKSDTIINKTALEFCARKVAGYSGDIRRGLHICRRAFELRDINDSSRPMRDVKAAEDELYQSPECEAIKTLPFFGKLLLTAFVLAIKGNNLNNIDKCNYHIMTHDSQKISVPLFELNIRFFNLILKFGKIRTTQTECNRILLRLIAQLEALRVADCFQEIPMDITIHERPVSAGKLSTSRKSRINIEPEFAPMEMNEQSTENTTEPIDSTSGFQKKTKKTSAVRKSPSFRVDECCGDVAVVLLTEIDLVVTALSRDSFCAQQLNLIDN